MTHPKKTKTSITDPLRVDWLETGGERVGMTIAPGKHSVAQGGFLWARDLAADLDALAAAGTTQLVCLLEDTDLGRLEITGLGEAARRRGLTYVHFPILDVTAPRPDQRAALEAVLEGIDRAVAAGGRVVIHCEGGLGRTGTVAGCWLVRQGQSPEAALAELVRVRKSERCPEAASQRAYIRAYTRSG